MSADVLDSQHLPRARVLLASQLPAFYDVLVTASLDHDPAALLVVQSVWRQAIALEPGGVD